MPKEIRAALEMLCTAGYEAYIVGGCVRDSIMGTVPHDYDITTSALPQQTKRVFGAFRTIDTGIAHGTVTVLIGKESVEITTYRIDGSYSDSRHPDSVCFTPSLQEDLARRDFTCNAIAFSPVGGLFDPFGGQSDIQSRTIRAVGQAHRRFEEDALRILRGLRFASALDFTIESETAAAMRKCADRLDSISGERILSELCGLLCGKAAGRVIGEYYDILDKIVPGLSDAHGFEQHNPYHIYDVLEHTIRVVEGVPAEPALRLAALLHDIGKPKAFTVGDNGIGHFRGHAKISLDISARVLDRLRPSGEMRRRVLAIVEHHDIPMLPTEKNMLRFLNRFGKQITFDLLDLHRADILAQNPAPEYACRLDAIEQCRAIVSELIDRQSCFSLRSLAVNGNDLIGIGFKPGAALGKALDRLLDAVIDGDIENERTKLLAMAREMLEES